MFLSVRVEGAKRREGLDRAKERAKLHSGGLAEKGRTKWVIFTVYCDTKEKKSQKKGETVLGESVEK